MTIPINYSEAELCDIIIWRREGHEWSDVTKKLAKKYGSIKSVDAVRHAYKRYEHLYDISDEKFLVDTLKSSTRKTIAASKASKESREVLKAAVAFEDVLEELDRMASKLKIKEFKAEPMNHTGRPMTIEMLVSDIHAGLKYNGYNTKITTKRVKEYTKTLLDEVTRLNTIYSVEKIIVALLGDLINSANMHGVESERDCDLSTPEQVAFIVKLLFEELFVPLGQRGISIHVPCIPGNHDRFESKRTFVYPGKHSLSWIIYHQLKALCHTAGYEHITFDITEESYIVGNIYGDTILWEHGDGVRGNSKQSLENHVQKRQVQIGKMIDFFRMGHLHEYKVFGRGRIILNASICGQTSFAKVLGYNSEPSQTLNYYVKTKRRPTSFYKSFAVYLGD